MDPVVGVQLLSKDPQISILCGLVDYLGYCLKLMFFYAVTAHFSCRSYEEDCFHSKMTFKN